jgi:hypothetical protein
VAVDVIGVAPLFLVLGGGWSEGSASSEKECNDASSNGLLAAFGEVLSDAFKNEDPPDRLDNKPESRQR